MSLAGNQLAPAATPAAKPTYILRGHNNAGVHALQFYKQNAFLISGDADGWLIVWSLASKRAVACWKAHEGSILGMKSWGDNVVTHGRDHTLRVWQLPQSDLEGEILDVRLPNDEAESQKEKGREPWLLHSMAVSALNFCAFALCEESVEEEEREFASRALLASPNALDLGGIDFFQLPSEHRLSVLKADPKIKTGMVMALDLFHQPSIGLLTVVSAYEDGHTMVHRRRQSKNSDEAWFWDRILANRPHTQPVLSLERLPSKDFYLTSSVDAVIAKSAIPSTHPGIEVTAKAAKASNTKHAGQQDLTVRDDGRIFATAGWDARVRVYSCKTLKEVAVLKWHKEGCSSIAFADVVSPHAVSITAPATDPHQLLVAPKTSDSALETIKCRRGVKAQQIHWLAAGGKDAKISLWDIY